jgi:hypothetical protein
MKRKFVFLKKKRTLLGFADEDSNDYGDETCDNGKYK